MPRLPSRFPIEAYGEHVQTRQRLHFDAIPSDFYTKKVVLPICREIWRSRARRFTVVPGEFFDGLRSSRPSALHSNSAFEPSAAGAIVQGWRRQSGSCPPPNRGRSFGQFKLVWNSLQNLPPCRIAKKMGEAAHDDSQLEQDCFESLNSNCLLSAIQFFVRKKSPLRHQAVSKSGRLVGESIPSMFWNDLKDQNQCSSNRLRE